MMQANAHANMPTLFTVFQCALLSCVAAAFVTA
jgi:hypothetical protein